MIAMLPSVVIVLAVSNLPIVVSVIQAVEVSVRVFCVLPVNLNEEEVLCHDYCDKCLII